jgi:hypothetical protein
MYPLYEAPDGCVSVETVAYQNLPQAFAWRRPGIDRHPVLAAAGPGCPGRAEVWSRWVGIAQRTGFGLVSPLPGIWPSLHLDTAITLPVGVETYAVYALYALYAPGWRENRRSARGRAGSPSSRQGGVDVNYI